MFIGTNERTLSFFGRDRINLKTINMNCQMKQRRSPSNEAQGEPGGNGNLPPSTTYRRKYHKLEIYIALQKHQLISKSYLRIYVTAYKFKNILIITMYKGQMIS